MDTGVSASIDVNKSHGLSMYTLESTNTDTEDLSVNKHRNDVTESLNIDKSAVPGSKPSYEKYDFEKEDSAISPSCSCSTSLPFSSNEGITTRNTICSIISSEHLFTHPQTNPKPISAMKGNREKQRAGGPSQKLTVKWAPEVYDPVPTSVSHAVTNKQPQKQSKKNSKSKQKNGGKSSRGNKNKNKFAEKRGLV